MPGSGRIAIDVCEDAMEIATPQHIDERRESDPRPEGVHTGDGMRCRTPGHGVY